MSQSDNERSYSSAKYRTPDGAPADIVIFTITKQEKRSGKKSLPVRELKVLLIRRKAWPFQGMWALPGGFSKETETMEVTARRELEEETGVRDVHLEYLGVYSAPGRDPRGWIISHAYCALVNEALLAHRQAADDAEEVGLFAIDDALENMELAFDHREIMRDAYSKIREQMLASTIAKQFLPERFTLGELHQVIRTVVPGFEEHNFIRKITSTQSRKGIMEEARDANGEKQTSIEYSQRPAQLYRFTGYEPPLSIYG
ncbi:NUDIX domain-containing protein [Paenibacillus contaminans]|uniref:ADP-ribose pyrophosphatase n=1 Tax=Paenibacillus contaminans TaxID=450362 RepID=A0A329MPH9_9BACL|nr:NUDIX domain-containing protein [Paenibacillus contaminans]RAV21871.1 ADP-ribose pyrophosphatase [Paenibacillus contaminans]